MLFKKKNNNIEKDVWGYNKKNKSSESKEKKTSKNNFKKKNNAINSNSLNLEVKKKEIFFSKFKKIFYRALFIFLFSWMITGLYLLHYSNEKTLSYFWKISNFLQPGLNWNRQFTRLLDVIDCKNTKNRMISYRCLTSNNHVVQIKIKFCYRIFNPKKYFFLVEEKKRNTNLDRLLLFCSKKIIRQYTSDDILSCKIINIQEKIFDKICKKKFLINIGIHGQEVKIQKVIISKIVKNK